jgi:hypothetical protein
VRLARQFTAAAAIAWLLIACALAATTAFAAQRAPKAKHEPQAPIDTCKDEVGLTMLASPMAPWKGAPLRVVFAAEKPLAGELSLIAPNGHVAATNSNRRGGPPYFWFAEVASPAAGTWQAILVRHGASADCATVVRQIVVQKKPAAGPRAGKGVWPIKSEWNRDTENLYSAWIETLFDAPLDEAPSWKAMHEVLRDPSRNVLFNHLGLREDQKGLVIQPDCADVPYFLRA